MTEHPHIFHGEWNELVTIVHTRMCDHSVEGECAIRIKVVESVWDSFCYCFVLRNAVLGFTGTRWYRVSDFNKWKQQTGLVPEMLTLSKTLDAEEANYFPAFFDSLATENVHMMLEETPGFTLDGSDTVVELFRDSQLVRKFEWDAQLRTRGPMQQLEKLMERSRTYFPNR